MTRYFSDRELGSNPRLSEEFDHSFLRGLLAEIDARINDASFGAAFPENCTDGHVPCGCDGVAFWNAAKLHVPAISPNDIDAQGYMLPHVISENMPDNLAILDLIEFCFDTVASATVIGHHPYSKHNHFEFDKAAGQTAFQERINLVFARNGIAFELNADGRIERLGPPGLGESLRSAIFQTGDTTLDKLLEDARRKFLSPQENERRDALEKLWDVYERLKTLEPGKEKREQATKILDRSARKPKFRAELEKEAKALTDIGNNLHIRHSETNQEPIETNEQVDYLFERLFGFIRLLLRMTSRGG